MNIKELIHQIEVTRASLEHTYEIENKEKALKLSQKSDSLINEYHIMTKITDNAVEP